MIHSCSYYCDRPECIKAQRDELRDKLAQPEQEPVAFYVYEWINPGDGIVFRSLRSDEHHMGRDPDRVISVPPQRKPLMDGLEVKFKRELFRFHSKQEWVNKAQSWYANCGVRRGYYITVDAAGHVMHIGRCFKDAAYPVICYELQTNWRDAQGIKGEA